MIRERKAYLEKNRETRANGYYLRNPKTVFERWSKIYKSISNLKGRVDNYTQFFEVSCLGSKRDYKRGVRQKVDITKNGHWN